MNSDIQHQNASEWTSSFLPAEAPSGTLLMPCAVAMPMRQTSSSSFSRFDPPSTTKKENNVLSACFNGVSRHPIHSASKLLSFVPRRRRRPTTKANIKPSRHGHNKNRYPAILSSWDNDFLQFLTLPATHRYLSGRPIPRRKLVVWGRQNTYRTSSERLPTTMIRMNSETCISFADPKAMNRMGNFIQEQRQLNEPKPFAPIDLSPANFERGMEEQYKRMEQQFRSELLQMVGLDMKSSEKPSIVQSPTAWLSPSSVGAAREETLANNRITNREELIRI